MKTQNKDVKKLLVFLGVILAGMIAALVIAVSVSSHSKKEDKASSKEATEAASASATETTKESTTEKETTTAPTTKEETTTEEVTTEETTTEETEAPTEATEPETPAPTEAPTAPPTQAPTQAPTEQPPAPAYSGSITAVSQAEIDQLRATLDTNARGYGGLTYHSYCASDQNYMNSIGANGRVLLDNGTQKNVCLTFQEGWENNHTAELLDILKQYGVKGTFFITHSYAENNKALVQRMINEGHQVGSHTYACPDGGIASHSMEEIMNDALKMQQYMLDTFGYNMNLYNYNSGTWSPASMVMLSKMGYTVTLCTTSYSDYDAGAVIDAGSVAAQMNQALIPGTIYAFHVTNVATIQMMPSIIQNALNQGYTFTGIH